MFWGLFFYNKKGPCHVQEKETPQEKRERKANLDAHNLLIKKANKAKQIKGQKKWLREWTKAYRRAPSGIYKMWKHNKETSVFVVKNS